MVTPGSVGAWGVPGSSCCWPSKPHSPKKIILLTQRHSQSRPGLGGREALRLGCYGEAAALPEGRVGRPTAGGHRCRAELGREGGNPLRFRGAECAVRHELNSSPGSAWSSSLSQGEAATCVMQPRGLCVLRRGTSPPYRGHEHRARI